MKFDTKLFACILASIAMTTACGNDSNDEPCNGECTETQTCNLETNQCEDPAPKPECIKDIDCTGNLICVDNHCVEDEPPKPECTENKDCTGNLICKEEKCVPECNESSDCDGDKICKSNKCVLECETNDECSGDMPICRKNHCRPICDEDEDCEEGVCLQNTCVACRNDEDCADSSLHCTSEHLCVECNENADCGGNLYCEDNACKAECETAEDCASEKPYCIENLCQECENSDQCDGTKVCKENVCAPECTTDFECENNLKCNDEQTCVECITDEHCGPNHICAEQHCQEGVINDIDADGTPDEEDVCPYNPKYTTQTDVDCNLVVDTEGNIVFEIYHAADFDALRKYLNPEPPANPVCNETQEGETPVAGDCCTENFPKSCQSDKFLNCENGIITETPCQYGCGEAACNLCKTPAEGETPAEGDCCDQSMPTTCENDRLTACINGIITTATCQYGCGELSCNFCNEPTDPTALEVGDCCDPTTFGAHCSEDETQYIQCENGIVTATTCTDKCFKDSPASACIAVSAPELTIRLMKDINLSDALSEKDLKTVAFEPVKVVWKETKTNESTGEKEVIAIHNNAQNEPYIIDDENCVASWASISLERMEFDGNNHSIVFQNEEKKSCALAHPFFESVKDSHVHDLILNYNVRGMISSIFANDVENSKIANVGIKGNVHLESEPAVEEAESYLSNGTAVAQKYESSVFAKQSTQNIWTDLQFLGNVTQTLKHTRSMSEQFAGFSGLFGHSERDVITNASIEIPDYFLGYRREFALFGKEFDKDVIDNPSVKAEYISIASESADITQATSFAVQSGAQYPNGIKVKTGDVYLPTTISYYPMGTFEEQNDITGNVEFEAGNITNVEAHADLGFPYATFKFLEGTIKGDINVQTKNIQSGKYFGLADKFAPKMLEGKIIVNTGNISVNDEFQGLAKTYVPSDEVLNVEGNEIAVTVQNVTFSKTFGNYYGLSSHIKNSVKALKLKTGNLSLNKATYYGLTQTLSTKVNVENVTIENGDIIKANLAYGVARTIEQETAISNLSMKMNDVTQASNSPSTQPGYFCGIASTFNGTLSKSEINIASIDSIGHIVPLSTTCSGNVNGVDILIGNVQTNAFSTTGFDGICYTITDKASINNINLNVGNVFLQAATGNVLARSCEPGAELNNIRAKIKTLISTKDTYVFSDLKCSMTNTAVQVNHLQGANAAIFKEVSDGTSITDFSVYADLYGKTSVSGLIYSLKGKDVTMERVFTAARLSSFNESDDATHKATDANRLHQPHIVKDPNNLEVTLDLGQKLDINTKHIYWLKRDEADKAANKEYIIDNDLTAQFLSVVPSSTEFALSTQGTPHMDPADTLSGCEDIDSSCKTNWSKTFLSVTEPDGKKINVPWLKTLSELNP